MLIDCRSNLARKSQFPSAFLIQKIAVSRDVLENIETGMVRIRVVERKIHRGRTGLASAKRTTRGKDDMTSWRKVKVMESWRMESQRMQAENRRTFKEFVGRVVDGGVEKTEEVELGGVALIGKDLRLKDERLKRQCAR